MAKSWESIQPVRFGSYQLVERVAMGGMAEVYLARPDGQARFVALKRILPQIAADEDFVAMFIDEAKIAGQLDHPNVAQIYDVGKIDKSYFIAMEYVSGHDLRILWDRVRDAGANGKPSLPIALGCHIARKICEGLDFAHRRKDSRGRPLNIIHRDVSPQNMLISYDGDLKIIDFGVAKAAGRLSKTQTGILKGKFAYMAPEQARGELIDHRADVFAIGVILYELLTGDRAFRAETDFGLLEKVRRVEMVPARALRPEIPRDLERVLAKALSRDAADRYPWASALAADLDRVMSDQGWSSSREDLAAFVQRAFKTEFQEERRRLAAYRAYFSDDADERSSTVIRGERPQATAGTDARDDHALSAPLGDVVGAGDRAAELLELREQARRIARGRTSLVAEEADSNDNTDEVQAAVSDPRNLARRVAEGQRLALRNADIEPLLLSSEQDDIDQSMTASVPKRGNQEAGSSSFDPVDHTVLDDGGSLESVEPDATIPAPVAPGGNAPAHEGRARNDPTDDDEPIGLRHGGHQGPPGEQPREAPRDLPRESRLEPNADARPDTRGEARPDVRSEGRADARADGKTSVRAPGRRGPRPEERGRAVATAVPTSAPASANRYGPAAIAAAGGIGIIAGSLIAVLMGHVSASGTHPVVFVTTPRQAEVRMGDVVVCSQTPCVVPLEPGRYEVQFRAPGAGTLARPVDVTAEGTPPVDVVLERRVSGVVLETVPAGAHVTIDDTPLEGLTPVTLPALVVGSTVRLKLQQDGFEPLEVSRTVDDAKAWRYDLPTPTTAWTIVPEPADALIEGPGRDRDGRHVVVVGRRGAVLRVRRPGCEERELTLRAVGRAEAEQKVVLECQPLDSGIVVRSRARPAMKIDGVEVSRLASLEPYPMPAGTWTVVLRGARGRPESHVVELRSGEVHTLSSRVR